MIGYYDLQSGGLDQLAALCSRGLEPHDVPLSADIRSNVPVYDMAARYVDLSGERRRDLMAEWAWVLGKGPGVLVMTGGCRDLDAVDRETVLRCAREWFDPDQRKKSQRIYWRWTQEYLKAIGRSRQPAGEKFRCYAVLGKWVRCHGRRMIRELKQ